MPSFKGKQIFLKCASQIPLVATGTKALRALSKVKIITC